MNTEISHENKLAILKKRALELSQEKQEESKETKTIEVLEFLLENEKYAFETKYVKEVFPFKNCTPLPCVPSFIQGLINVRRRIVSVVNLKKFFELAEAEDFSYNQIIILSFEAIEMAFLADQVIGISQLIASELQVSLPSLTGKRQQFLKGVTKEQLALLDGKLLLTDEKIIIQKN